MAIHKRWTEIGGAAAAVMLALGCSAQATPTTQFFTSRSAFEAALSSETTIDFEGQVADGSDSTASSETLSGVTFSGSLVGIAGANSTVLGNPFESAILFLAQGTGIQATLPSNVTAVGGWFGNISADSQGTLTLTGTTGTLATENVTFGDLGQGKSESFFGFIVTGDTIDSIAANSTDQNPFLGIDNFSFGVKGSRTAVPEPGDLLLLGSAILGLCFVRRRRAAL